jgi:hypothetical protein
MTDGLGVGVVNLDFVKIDGARLTRVGENREHANGERDYLDPEPHRKRTRF